MEFRNQEPNTVFFKSDVAFKAEIGTLFHNRENLGSIHRIVIDYADSAVQETYQQDTQGHFFRNYTCKEKFLRFLTLFLWGENNTKKIQKSFDDGFNHHLLDQHISPDTNNTSIRLRKFYFQLSIDTRKIICDSKNPSRMIAALERLIEKKIFYPECVYALKNSDNPFKMANTLIKLNYANLLKKEIIDIVVDYNDREEIVWVLTKLSRTNLLNKEVIDIAMNSNNPYRMALVLAELNQANLLKKDIIDIVMGFIDPYVMAQILVKLKYVNCLDDYLCHMNKNPHSMKKILVNLHNDGLMKINMNPELKRAILMTVMQALSPQKMSEVILKLKKQDTLTLEAVASVGNAVYPGQMALYLRKLKHENILAPENIMAIANTTEPSDMMSALERLESAHILTPYHRMLLICSKDSYKISKEIVINRKKKLFIPEASFFSRSIDRKDLEFLSKNENSKLVEQALLIIMRSNVLDTSAMEKWRSRLEATNHHMIMRIIFMLDKYKIKKSLKKTFEQFVNDRASKILEIKTIKDSFEAVRKKDNSIKFRHEIIEDIANLT